MTVIGPHRDRALRPGLRKVGQRILRSALIGTGFSFRELDEALHGGSSRDIVLRYLRTGPKGARGPQAKAVQGLENRVAEILGRDPFEVVVVDGEQWLAREATVALEVVCPAEFKAPRKWDGRTLGFGVTLRGEPEWWELAYGRHYPPSDDVMNSIDRRLRSAVTPPRTKLRLKAWLEKLDKIDS